MTEIKQNDNWLGNRLDNMGEAELCGLIKEIARFRETGVLKEKSHLREFEKEFSDNVSHTRIGECMRLVEDAILFEGSRRYYNQTFY